MNFFGKIRNEINTLPILEKKVFFVDAIYFYGINNLNFSLNTRILRNDTDYK